MAEALSIRIDLSEFNRTFDLKEKQVGYAIQKILRDGSVIVERLMKQKAPVRTGRLRASISSDIQTAIGRMRATISPHVKYALFINSGTKESPGRYVPSIGKRLVNPPEGMHPGVKATHFIERTEREARPRIQRIAQRIMAQELAK